MVRLNFKTLYANGDSWTAGDIVDPDLFGDDLSKVNDPKNKPYRLPRVWPHKIGKELGIEVINNSHAGSSNDRIFRSTVNDILGLLLNNKPEDLLVVIGWSSPERKDFFYKWHNEDGGEWECLYPAELDHWTSERKELIDFYKLYVKNHWHAEEFITRHCIHNISLHHFLKSLNIKHIFFNSFYENKEDVLNKDSHQLLESPEFENYISDFNDSTEFNTIKRLEINNILKEYKNVYKNVFYKQSFISFLLGLNIEDEVLNYHPTEKGHQLWASNLAKYISSKYEL
tara:strand:- start:4207 stop:5061 length:855 start_codon:yes stop_codon:yes gene_type:complete